MRTLRFVVFALTLVGAGLTGCESDDSSTPLPPDAAPAQTTDSTAGSDGGSNPDGSSSGGGDASGGNDAADSAPATETGGGGDGGDGATD